MLKYRVHKHLGEEIIYFTATSTSQSTLEGVRAGAQAGQETGDRSRCRGRGRVLLTGLLFMVCSVYFLIASRTTSSGGVSTYNGLGLLPSITDLENVLQVAYSLYII